MSIPCTVIIVGEEYSARNSNARLPIRLQGIVMQDSFCTRSSEKDPIFLEISGENPDTRNLKGLKGSSGQRSARIPVFPIAVQRCARHPAMPSAPASDFQALALSRLRPRLGADI